MKHATSPATSTPENHPVNQSNPSQNDTDHSCGFRKAIEISDNITLVDVALERVRHHWRTKKAKKAGTEGIPPNVAQLITQALTISRAHLLDYRELVTQEQGSKQEITQSSPITAEELMDGLSPRRTLDGKPLPDSLETILKLRSVAYFLLQSDSTIASDDNTGGALLILHDLIDEMETKSSDWENHCHELFLELENRLESCFLIRRDLKKRTQPAQSAEV
ncbi:MAG: hypothetical protein PHI97_08945 [Desulfobulbus sp.]|nr:hypothetical protein [Desulfobulbus sp.]